MTTPAAVQTRSRAALQQAEADAAIEAAAARSREDALTSDATGSNGRGGAARPIGVAFGLPPRPDAEQVEAMRERDDRRRRAMRTETLERAAQIPARYAAADLENVEAVPASARPRYVEATNRLLQVSRRPVVVVLCGVRGPGKTHLACGLIRDFCRRGFTARYAKAMTIFSTIKREFGRKGGDELAAERQFTAPSLLVIDEMQVRGDTKWEDDRLTDLIDDRYGDNKVTVLITNLTPGASKDAAGESIHNRIREGGVYVECDWPSLRPTLVPAELFAGEVPIGDYGVTRAAD